MTPPPLTADEIASPKTHAAFMDAWHSTRLSCSTQDELDRHALRLAEYANELAARVAELAAEKTRLRSGSLLRAPVVVPRIDLTTEEGRAALTRGAAVARSLREPCTVHHWVPMGDGKERCMKCHRDRSAER